MLIRYATVTTDRKFLSFMRSYPNLIPLSAKQVPTRQQFQFSSIRSMAIISIVSLRVAENGLWKFRSSVMSTQ